MKTSFVSSVFETATNVRKASADSVLRWVASMDWRRPMAPPEQLAAAAAGTALLLVELDKVANDKEYRVSCEEDSVHDESRKNDNIRAVRLAVTVAVKASDV